MPRRAVAAVLTSVAATTVLAGCGPDQSRPERSEATSPASRSSERTDADPSITPVASGLDAPWSIAFYRKTALISERDSGRILELTDDGRREVATVDGVSPGGDVPRDNPFSGSTESAHDRPPYSGINVADRCSSVAENFDDETRGVVHA